MGRDTSLGGRGKLKATDFKALRKQLIEAHKKDLATYVNTENLKQAHIHTYTFQIPQVVRNNPVEIWKGGEFKMSKVDNTFEIDIRWGNRTVDECEQSYFMQTLYAFLKRLPKSDSEYGARFVTELEAYDTEDDYDYNNNEFEVDVYGGWKER